MLPLRLDNVDPKDIHVTEISIMQDSQDLLSVHDSFHTSTSHRKLEIEATINMNLYKLRDTTTGWHLLKKDTGDVYDGDKTKKQLREMSVLGILREKLGVPDLQFMDLTEREKQLFFMVEELMYPKK